MRPPHRSSPSLTPPMGLAAVSVPTAQSSQPVLPSAAESAPHGYGTPHAPTEAWRVPLPGTANLPSGSSRPNTGSLARPAPLPGTPHLVDPYGKNEPATLGHDGQSVQFPRAGTLLRGPRGDYEVTRVLGEGAFGAVYECLGPFDQSYAVKMVRPANRPYTEVQAEWAKELARLMSLRHPNVVYIYDAFELSHLFYLALERCDHTLKDMLGAPMREGLVLELARQMLAAVQFLHDNEIVHDDLHPGNVLITHAADRPQVKISDFGISHELRGEQAVRPSVVHHAIMAPEILSSGYTSRQSDIYQVGLLLYWMLAGEPAIDMSAPYDELVRVVAAGEPRRKAEALHSPMSQIIAKMLRRRESFRYSSAREVWADLRALDAWQTRSLFPMR